MVAASVRTVDLMCSRMGAPLLFEQSGSTTIGHAVDASKIT